MLLAPGGSAIPVRLALNPPPSALTYRPPAETGFFDCKGLDASVARLRMILETQGPFDAIWGFSQGAATASLIVGLLEGPHRHPIFAAPAREGYAWPPPPFKFAIFNSGFFPKDPRIRAVSGIQTASLHVLGRGGLVRPLFGGKS